MRKQIKPILVAAFTLPGVPSGVQAADEVTFAANWLAQSEDGGLLPGLAYRSRRAARWRPGRGNVDGIATPIGSFVRESPMSGNARRGR